MSESRKKHVEVLSFAGCPNAQPAVEMVERLVAELTLDAAVEQIEINDIAAGERLRFLGSPTIRVDGRDVEPGADERADVLFSCRLDRSDSGLVGLPDENRVRTALSST